MTGPTAAIVLPTDAIGGAEKRLTELWAALRRTRPERHVLVLSTKLLAHLAAMREFSTELSRFHEDVVVHEPGDQARRRAMNRFRDRADVWHLVMSSPLAYGLVRPTRTVFTVPIASMNLLNVRGRVALQAGAAFADVVDVLDPGLTDDLRTLLPWKRQSIHNTPGSQIDLNAYRPLSFDKKRNVLVFCGLLSRAKNADRLLACLPEVHARLLAEGHRDLEYLFLGRDTPELEFYARAREMAKRVPVSARFEPNPASVLSEAKVFFSVQPLTNYPSKSLLEGIACGALPVVTDVGDSRRIADDTFAQFVPGQFTAADLGEACVRTLALSTRQFDERVEAGRRFISSRFSLEAAATYYSGLYAEAAKGNA